jgi:DNA-binding transcriptional MerR regulator
MTHIKSAPISQAAVEQVTGLSREVLRKWELRYQFPLPIRGARGQRLYTPEDVEKLHLVQRLLLSGMRPGKLVPLSLTDLQALLANGPRPVVHQHPDQIEAAAQALLACLLPGATPFAIRANLEQLIKENGLAQFVEHYLPAFNLAVGKAWAVGRLGVHAEHHYTETVRTVVLRALAHLHPVHGQTRVLLTTPPGELHGLGLLALQAALTLQGADCVCLGTQTPAPDVVQAVHDFGVKLVAISVSVCLPPAVMCAYLMELRQRLPADCALWIGGQGGARLPADARVGLAVFHSTQQAVQAWRQRAEKSSDLL